MSLNDKLFTGRPHDALSIKDSRIQGFKSICLQQPIHFATVLTLSGPGYLMSLKVRGGGGTYAPL